MRTSSSDISQGPYTPVSAITFEPDFALQLDAGVKAGIEGEVRVEAGEEVVEEGVVRG
jgi:hypothetical protein